MRDQLIKQRQSCSMLLNIYQLGFLWEPQQRFQKLKMSVSFVSVLVHRHHLFIVIRELEII